MATQGCDWLSKAALGGAALGLALASNAALAQAGGEWKSGQQVYEKVCGHCHEKGLGPVIKGRGAPAEFKQIVRSGRRAMPAFRPSEIDDRALAQVMDHIR
ncbi:MAG: cytochrome c [Betaproteobacteria bacterium]|nr:cytochrome c [Betaproteobacteria bacterium]